MEKYLQDILKELKTLNTKVDNLEQGQATLTTEVQALKGDVQTLKTDVQALRGDVQILKTDVRTLKGDVQTLSIGLQDANTKLDVLYAQVARNREQEVQLDDVVARVVLLENDNKLLKKIVANL